MQNKILPFSPMDRIDHLAFGSGTIVEIDEQRTTIDFDRSGIRTFVTSTIKCSASDTPAPAKPTRPTVKAGESG